MRFWAALAVVIVVFAVIVAAVVYTKLLTPAQTYTSSQVCPYPLGPFPSEPQQPPLPSSSFTTFTAPTAQWRKSN